MSVWKYLKSEKFKICFVIVLISPIFYWLTLAFFALILDDVFGIDTSRWFGIQIIAVMVSAIWVIGAISEKAKDIFLENLKSNQ